MPESSCLSSPLLYPGGWTCIPSQLSPQVEHRQTSAAYTPHTCPHVIYLILPILYTHPNIAQSWHPHAMQNPIDTSHILSAIPRSATHTHSACGIHICKSNMPTFLHVTHKTHAAYYSHAHNIPLPYTYTSHTTHTNSNATPFTLHTIHTHTTKHMSHTSYAYHTHHRPVIHITYTPYYQ